MTLDNKTARRVILHLQGLTMTPHKKLGLDGLHDLIHQLGYVQVDSIQWVERAQHMILFARNQTYRPKHLKRLIEKDRHLFENWTHDASIIPCSFYPYWRHRFERKKVELAKKFASWQGDGYADKCEEMLQRIKDEGPLRSRDLERPDTGKQEMWQWHDGKAALEYLWRMGELCISQRDGFQKVYDLAHHGVHKDHYHNEVSHDEFVDWACREALDRLGFGSPGDIARFWDILTPKEAKDWVATQTNNTLIPVTVQGVKGAGSKELVARPDLASLIDTMPDMPKRIRALSPFDPVIRNRKRLEWLFGFEYRIEIYVPEVKRRWGYYIFPLLENDRLIGRIDMRADRKNDNLAVRKIWLEPKVKMSAARRSRLDSERVRQARLCGLKSVLWEDDAANTGAD